MKFKIDDEFKYFASKQITQINVDPDFYTKMSISEYNAISKHIENPKKILELGCGLGRMSIFLNSMLKNNAHYILADVSELSQNIKYGWDPKESYYNDLDLTSLFAKKHDLENFETFNLLSQNLNKFENIDLVMSFLSVGFHYPISEYLDTLLNITSNDATMIFGVRKGAVNLKDFKKYFNKIIIEKNTVDSKEELLILKGKK